MQNKEAAIINGRRLDESQQRIGYKLQDPVFIRQRIGSRLQAPAFIRHLRSPCSWRITISAHAADDGPRPFRSRDAEMHSAWSGIKNTAARVPGVGVEHMNHAAVVQSQSGYRFELWRRKWRGL